MTLKSVIRKVIAHIPIAALGGILYMGIELLWRGHTHWTMGVLGGVCFAAIGLLNEGSRPPPVLVQMLVSAMLVTALELVALASGTTAVCRAIFWGRYARSIVLRGFC